MIRNKICLSIDQMQKLKELGIDTKDASMCWVKDPAGVSWIVVHDEYCYEIDFMRPVPAFTLQDMMELMPELYPTINAKNKRVLDTIEHPDSGDTYLPNLYLYDGEWRCGYISFDCGEEEIAFSTDNPLDAAFEMLCWLAENNFLK